MPIHEHDRIRFHGWLIDHDLDEQVADAILAAMPPYDWHDLATKTDLAVMEQRTIDRFAGIDVRLDHMDRRFDAVVSQIDRRLDDAKEQSNRQFDRVDERMAGMALEIRAIMFTLIGLIVSVLLAGAAAMFG